MVIDKRIEALGLGSSEVQVERCWVRVPLSSGNDVRLGGIRAQTSCQVKGIQGMEQVVHGLHRGLHELGVVCKLADEALLG